MGDVLGGIFGSGNRTSQNVQVDPMTQQLNAAKLNQAQGLFDTRALSTFGQNQPGIYTPSADVNDLYRSARNAITSGPAGDPNNLMSLGDYANLGFNRDLYNNALSTNRADFGTALGNQQGLYNSILSGARGNFLDAMGTANNNFTNAMSTALGNRDFARTENANALGNSLATSADNYNRGLTINQQNLDRSVNDFNNTASNYISQIAAPEIRNNLALQGMEGSGAVNSAIAKETANVGLQYLMPLISQFNQQQASLGNQLMSTQGGLQSTGLSNLRDINLANLSTQAGLAQANANLQGQLGQGNANLQGQLGQSNAEMQNNLFGNLMSQQAGLFSNYNPTEKSFISSLPGVGINTFLAPEQAAASAAQRSLYPAQIASTLFPMADYGRSLQEQDLLRQQGLLTTAFTGLPYTPETKTSQRTSSQPLFNFFGQG